MKSKMVSSYKMNILKELLFPYIEKKGKNLNGEIILCITWTK